MTDLALSFDDARAFLMKKRQVEYSFAEDALLSIKKVVAVYGAYQQIFPDDYRSRLKKLLPSHLAELRNKPINLEDKCVDAIGRLFPINECMLDEVDDCIWIDPQGPSMSWDEFDELVNNTEDSYFSSESSLSFPVLIWSIGNDIGRETWGKLDQKFKWGVAWPESIITTKYYFDQGLLQKNLERAGLGDFMTSIKIAWRETDNYFFDFDENYSYEEADTPIFDAKCICRLYHEWQAGKSIGESNTRAMLMLRQDPSVLQRIVDIMSESLEKPSEAKTLMEVFAEQEAKNG